MKHVRAKEEKRACDGGRRIQTQTHLSYDDTAGRTLAQNHRDKQKSRLPHNIKHRIPKQPQANQRLMCYSPGARSKKIYKKYRINPNLKLYNIICSKSRTIRLFILIFTVLNTRTMPVVCNLNFSHKQLSAAGIVSLIVCKESE